MSARSAISGCRRSPSVRSERQPHAHRRTVVARHDLETSAKLLDTLAHTGDAHAASPARDVLERGARNAAAPIFDLQHEGLGVTLKPDASRLTRRVPVDV